MSSTYSRPSCDTLLALPVSSTYSRPSCDTLLALPVSSPSPALRVAPSTTNKTISHDGLRTAVRALAARIIAPAISKGETVALLLPNGSLFCAAFLAIAHCGATAAPLNPRYTRDELVFYLKDAAVSAVLVPPSAEEADPVYAAAKETGATIIKLDARAAEPEHWADGEAAADDAALEARSPLPGDVAMVLHTSGTTSRPKCVPLSHENLCASIGNISDTYKLTASDATLLVMPLFHVHGLMAATLSTLATGGCVAIPGGSGGFSASSFWPDTVAAAATWYTAVPTIHQILLARAENDFPRDAPPPLRFVRSCSASLAPSVLERLEKLVGVSVLEAYAMTEAAHQMTSNPMPESGKLRKPGTVGLPQNVEVAILDPENALLSCEQVGEVCIRGKNVTSGYANNPKANEEAFAGGWFHTGDQGILDSDGYLRLTGRIKELVNRGGEKISPLEVDAVLLSHESVTEAVSFAVPDEKYGEEINAAVILKPESVGSVSVADLQAYAKDRLADFKVPKRFFISEDLPRTATGKIQRRIVSKHFLDQLAASASDKTS